ncbi:TetR family transcriptional regulator [Streptomyces sp. CNQ-509]|uniref:TetR/AcrR family transcriptional regulator n=1 Tax=unclassified Streptomyces TaxID=2593676 RepID=UPI00062DE492|nr:TetR/AcrR family transcriptional regulator [Streptomyces sp. CNQ-509]AKH82271.1 TetR family transcriptional regulator [Streptomyces sp. CNQ-509]
MPSRESGEPAESAGRRPAPRRRRADAERSRSAIVDAAVRLLGERPEASVEAIAAAAGVTRQTVYAHYPSRNEVLSAVFDRVTAETDAALDAARLDELPAATGLLRLLDVSWEIADRYPGLRHAEPPPADRRQEDEQHRPITDRLERIARRGQESGEFARDAEPHWLAAATVALGHAAGAEVAAGRMTPAAAAEALRVGVLRLHGAEAEAEAEL